MTRDYTISIMRVLAMAMIVLYHCFCYNTGAWPFPEQIIRNYKPEALELSYLGLNTFMFISGFLYFEILTQTHHYDDKCKFVKGKIKRLLVPYLFWGIFLCVLMPDRYSFKIIPFGISHLWFLLMLFISFLIVIFTRKLWDRKTLFESGLVFFILLILDFLIIRYYPLNDDKGRSFLAMKSVAAYLPIFYIGVVSAKFDIIHKIKINKVISIFLLILMLIIGSYMFTMHLRVAMFYQWLPAIIIIYLCYRLLEHSRLTFILSNGGGQVANET